MNEPGDTKEDGKRSPEKRAADDKLHELLEARRKLNDQIRAKRGEGKTQARKLRERRAILTGLAVMDALERDAAPAEQALIQHWRDTWLQKPAERALFNLPAKAPTLVVDRPRPSADEPQRQEA